MGRREKIEDLRAPQSLPPGWRISGWGPAGEGVEASGPHGLKLVTDWEEDLPEAISLLMRQEHQGHQPMPLGGNL